MTTKSRNIFTRYGTWVATTRWPQFPFIRRLASADPNSFGKMVAYLWLCQIIATGMRVWVNHSLKEVTLTKVTSKQAAEDDVETTTSKIRVL